MTSFVYVSCMQNVISSVELQKDISSENQIIVKKVTEFKRNGLLDYMYNESCRVVVDSEKAQKFLEILYEKLRKYVEENPEAITQIDVLLSYIDQNYTKFANLAEASNSCVSYYISNICLIKKVVSVTTATVAVCGVAYATGFLATIKGFISSISNLIPKWLVISGNSLSINLVW